jgi:hypothetical protein
MLLRRWCWPLGVLFVAAAVSPAVAGAAAGDECGTVGVPPAGTVVVASGTITCADATTVVNRYFGEFTAAPDNNEWVRFDGWECWTPSPDQAIVNGFGTECNRGGDNVQIRT